MIINHVALENEWDKKEIFDNAKTLILGSFNPFNPNGDNTDFYYGRCTNYFWKTIAEIKKMNPNIFFNNLELKLDIMRQYKFCFLDLINSIEINHINNNDRLIQEFINKKIYAGYTDQTLFTSNTSYNGEQINLKRNYNHRIFEILQEGKIQKVIHTMGNITIGIMFETKWKEKKLGDTGFQGIIDQLKYHKSINFISESYSPSGRVVKVKGEEYKLVLKNWINKNLNLS
jgi:hypothetical protein